MFSELKCETLSSDPFVDHNTSFPSKCWPLTESKVCKVFCVRLLVQQIKLLAMLLTNA